MNQNPLVADNSRSSVASSRSRPRRSRRSTVSNRVGAAFDVLGDGVRNGLTVCCDGVTVQRHHRDVIDEVSCLFRGGRVTAVVNCCGTHSALALLAAVAGRVDCAAGNIVMNGVPVSASSYQAQMSFVEEKDSLTDDSGGATRDLLVDLTVRENLEFASALRVANSAQAYSVDEMLQQLLLESHATARIRDCPLYVRRRVAIGKELLLNPSVLLLDEPTDGLATHEAQQLLTILSKLAAPSMADAEARHVMREAMTNSAAASVTAASSSTAAAASPPESSTPPSRMSLYTPRHSRVHLRDGAASVAHTVPNTHVPSSTPAAAVSSPSRRDSSGSGVADGVFGMPHSEETQRVVVLSIVQPRWALLQYVHDVVLMERSRCIFAGSVQEMLSVSLPKSVLRCSVDGAAREGGERERSADPLAQTAAPVAPASFVEEEEAEAPAGSYDAVAASIHKTRRNEEFVHALYRLATTEAAAAVANGSSGAVGGIVAGDFPDFSSFTDHVEPSWTSQRVSSPAAAAAASLPSHVAVRADTAVYATPLSQLYAVLFGHARAQVTAYMEVCAAGLLSLPEASHQAPSGFTQLLHLFRFGFVELRHNFVWGLVALCLLVVAAAGTAVLYGVQVGTRGIQNCAGLLFFVVSCVVLQAVLSLDAQRREYASFYRYSRSGYYASWTFLTFRAVKAALWRFGLSFLVVLVVFALSFFGEPWRDYRDIFELGFTMAVLSYSCYFLVWFLCAWWPSDRVSRFIVFTFYTLNIVLGGLVLNLVTLPAVVRGASFLSVVRLAYESAMMMGFANKSFGCEEGTDSGSGAAVSALQQQHTLSLSEGKCHTGAEYAAYLGFDASRRWLDVGLLAALSGVLLLASWVMMALYRPRRKLQATI